VDGVTVVVTLTHRQRECLQAVAGGMTMLEAARSLWLSEETVKWHLKDARRRLDARTTTQAVARAVAAGLIEVQ
jgi:LuxR family quorum sensing-dependent transcriptional regulator